MASESRGVREIQLKQGQKIRVEIEDFSAGVLVVTFKHDKSIYRGVLLDAQLYHGVNQKRLESQSNERMELSPGPGADDESTKETQLPCSMERHTYKMDGQAIHPAFLQHPIQRQTKRPNCTRARILRPRRFICRKCKNLYQFLEGNGRVVTRLTDNPRTGGFRRDSIESETDRSDVPVGDGTLKMVRRSSRFKQDLVHDSSSVESKLNDSSCKNEIRQVATPIMPRLRLVRLEKQKTIHSAESSTPNQPQTHYRVANPSHSLEGGSRTLPDLNGSLDPAKNSHRPPNIPKIPPKIISRVSVTSTSNTSSRILRSRKSRKCTPNSIRLSAHDAILSRRTAKKRKASLSNQRKPMITGHSTKSERISMTKISTRESRDRHAKSEASQKIISTTNTSATHTTAPVDERPPVKKERRATNTLHNDSSKSNRPLPESNKLLDLSMQSSASNEHTNVYEFDDSDATATGLRPEDDLINKRRLEQIPPKQRWRKEEELRRIQDERSRVFGKRLGHSESVARANASRSKDAKEKGVAEKNLKTSKISNSESSCDNSTNDERISLKIKINRSPTKAGFYRCQIVDKNHRLASNNEYDSPESSDASSMSLPPNSVFETQQPSTSGTQDNTSPSTSFSKGDVVWGKILGWPWWPSVVKRIVPPTEESTGVTAEVQWLNWDQVSYIPVDKIVPFIQSFRSKYDRRKAKRGAYKSAVDEALRLANARNKSFSCFPDNHSSNIMSDAPSSVSSSQLDSGGNYCTVASTGEPGFSQHANDINNSSGNVASVADLASADRAFDSALQSFTLAAAVEHDGLAPPDPLTPLPDLGPSLSRAEEWCEIARVTLPTFSDDDDEEFNSKLALDPVSFDRIQAS